MISRHIEKSWAEFDEISLVLDIAFYEAQLTALGAADTPHERGMRNNYMTLISYGKRLLAAQRDGRPEAWMEYPD